MYPHVVQFETRSQQFKLEGQLIRERKEARAGKAVNRPSLLTKIAQRLRSEALENPPRDPRSSTDPKQPTRPLRGAPSGNN